jgi:ubiquinone biosynthesis protein
VKRREIAQWIRVLLPIETLVPESAARWRPIVQDAIGYIFAHVSAERLAPKLREQMALPLETSPEVRLLHLISRMPGLQKVGQVVARNRRIPPRLREALSGLENGLSDITAAEVRAIVEERLGDRLDRYAVRIDPQILSEGSVAAVMKFSWSKPEREREEGVFKVLKPHVPVCFAEDMRLLQRVGEYLAGKRRKYGFAVQEINETLEEVRLLLEHELDFAREQATLREAARMYRSSFGIRVPRLIPELCAGGITAMSAEAGVKVTEAFPHSAIRRARVAEQTIEALIAVPLFSWEDAAVFHADPHAGNLLYDEPDRELVVLDWALAERLDRESRRQLVLLALMTILRNPEGVGAAIGKLSLPSQPAKAELIREHVQRLFARFPEGASPGVLDAMMLLDEIALQGVRFPSALFLFRKVLFTLDGVLHDVAGRDVRIDEVILREFLARAVASFGLFHAPLKSMDFVTIQREVLWYPVRRWARLAS